MTLKYSLNIIEMKQSNGSFHLLPSFKITISFFQKLLFYTVLLELSKAIIEYSTILVSPFTLLLDPST